MRHSWMSGMPRRRRLSGTSGNHGREPLLYLYVADRVKWPIVSHGCVKADYLYQCVHLGVAGGGCYDFVTAERSIRQ